MIDQMVLLDKNQQENQTLRKSRTTEADHVHVNLSLFS